MFAGTWALFGWLSNHHHRAVAEADFNIICAPPHTPPRRRRAAAAAAARARMLTMYWKIARRIAINLQRVTEVVARLLDLFGSVKG